MDKLEDPVAEGEQVAVWPPPAAPHRLTYQPALDGVRGIAVALVLVFHLDVGIFDAGYLGVSVFFTLSGFLITSLLVDEWNVRSGGDDRGLDLGRFYVRRLKRLLPAAMTTLLAVALLATVGLVERTPSLQGDITAAAWNVFNWRELLSGDSYAALFEEESAVAHFWSLAIEEQFYLVWPLTMLLLVKRLRLARRGLLTVLAALFALSMASALVATPEAAYFATWTRAGEILAGALLAVWMSTSPTGRWPSWWRWLPGPALVAIVAASYFTPTATGWPYEGGLPFFALVSVALIAGLQASGPVTTAMSWVPLVAVGKVSYGVYLVHWPVFVVLDEERLGMGGWALAIVRLAVTAAIAVAMYFTIERPIRTSTRPIRPLVAAALAIAAMITVTVAAAAVRDDSTVAEPAPDVLGADPSTPANEATPITTVAPSSTAAAAGDPVMDDTASTTSSTTTTTAPVAAPVTMAVFGDSVPAWLLRDAAGSFDRTDVVVLNGAQEACDGMVDLPVGRDRRGTELFPPDDCFDWTVSYPETLVNATETDVAVLVLGQAPVIDRQIEGEWQGPCDGIDWYLDDVAARIEFLHNEGVRPVLAIPARYGERVSFMVEDDHLERVGCVRAAMLGLAARVGADVIDLDPVLCPDDDCNALRSDDGIHVDAPFAPEVLDELLDDVLELVSDETGATTTPDAPVGRR